MLLFVLLTAPRLCAAPATNAVPKFAVDLAAGSHLLGTPAARTLPLKTEFAALDIPLARVAGLTKQPDGPAVILTLQNGDKYTGTLTVKTLDLVTILGKLSIPVEQIVKLAPVETEAPAAAPEVDPAKIAATRGACCNNLRIIAAAKDQWALDHNNTAPAALKDLVGPNAYIRKAPLCPANGQYLLNGPDEEPSCSVHGKLGRATPPRAGVTDL